MSRIVVGALLLLVISAIFALEGMDVPAVAQAAPPVPDRIVFTTSRGGGIQIAAINADGTGYRRLTDPPGLSQTPVWSPDGRRIAYVSSRSGAWQVYTMNSDGTGQRQLTTPPGESLFPAWSPDGRRIVFVSGGAGNRQIFVMNSDGGWQRQLTGPPGESTVPVWSPDGARIAFVSTRDQGVRHLYVMNADGTGQTRLTRPEFFVANAFGKGEKYFATTGVLLQPGILHPAWSTDGTRIAFVIRIGRAEQQISVVNLSGSGNARVATGYAPAWSPDGKRMAFVVARVGDAQIYVMNADGTGARRLTPSGVNLLPAWSPDGRQIAFLASRNGGLAIYVMNADGSGERRLAPAAGDLSMLPVLSWRPR